MGDKYRSEFAYGSLMKCPECGKKFYCSNLGEWVYKRDNGSRRKTFCSWGCVRKFDKRQEEQAAARLEAGKMNHWRGKRITS